MCIHDLNGYILEVNDAYCTMSGYCKDELIGMHVSSIEAKESREQIASRIKNLVISGKNDRFETVHRRKDGTVFNAHVTVFFLNINGGCIASYSRDITKRIELEHLLISRSRDQQFIIDSSPAMIFFKDLNNRIVRVNRAFEEFMGLSRKDLEGKSAFDILPKEQAKDFWKDDQEVMSSGKEKRGIIEIIKRPGGTRIMQLDKVPFFNDQGKITGVIAFAIDITEQRKAEEALVENEKKFRLAFESARDAMLLADADTGILIDCNSAAERLFESSKGELTGKYFTALHPPEVMRTAKKLFKKRIKIGRSMGGSELPIITKSGNIKTVVISASLIMLGNRRIMQGVLHDITERKVMEDMIQKSEARYRGLVETQQDLIVRVNPEGLFTFVNDVYCKTFGKRSDELLGKSFMPLVHPDDLQATLKEMEKLRVPPFRMTVDQRAMTASGWRWLSWEDTAIHDKDGTLLEIQAVGRDITERKQAEEALKVAIKRKDEFISIASHELKTPLTSIKAFNQIIIKKTTSTGNKEILSIAHRMNVEINKLTSLVSDFLDVSKIAAGKLLFRKELFNIMEMILEVLNDMISISPEIEKKLEIRGKINMNIYGDRFRLSQVLLNLLTNAHKYAPETKKIIVDIKSLKKSIIISVIDFGPGIPEKDQERLFERFYQVNSGSDLQNGNQSLGLGLYIASEIIRRHNGKIWVKSKLGKGSVFSFKLPLGLQAKKSKKNN